MLNAMKLKSIGITRYLGLVVMLLLAFGLSGCGSTKVYTADKTVVHKDNVYNVSNVRIFSPRNEAVLADQSTVDLKGMDKKAFEKLLADNSNSVFVRQSFMLDADEMVYQAGNVSKWNDFDKMTKRFNGAQKDLTKFLADKKKTQLKLN